MTNPTLSRVSIALLLSAAACSNDDRPLGVPVLQPKILEAAGLRLLDPNDNPTSPSTNSLVVSVNWSPKTVPAAHDSFWVTGVSGGSGGPYYYEWHTEYCDIYDVCGDPFITRMGRDSSWFAIDVPAYVAYVRTRVLVSEDHAPNYPSALSGIALLAAQAGQGTAAPGASILVATVYSGYTKMWELAIP
ncbi:MAG: hypothetical protein U0132_22385 [Gemmatimonadaceae bacterium]